MVPRLQLAALLRAVLRHRRRLRQRAGAARPDLHHRHLPRRLLLHLNDANGSRSGNDAFSQNIGVVGGWPLFVLRSRRRHRPGVGGALVANQATYQSLGHYTGYGLQLDGGYGWAITDRWSTAGASWQVGYG
jgi:hypothetical protein